MGSRCGVVRGAAHIEFARHSRGTRTVGRQDAEVCPRHNLIAPGTRGWVQSPFLAAVSRRFARAQPRMGWQSLVLLGAWRLWGGLGEPGAARGGTGTGRRCG